MTDREREPRTGWETERLDDPADHADSHDTLELYVVTDDDDDDDLELYVVTDDDDDDDLDDCYFLVDEANDVRFAVCKSCLHVVCECVQEPPTSRFRNYKPAAPRHIRDDHD